MIDTKKLGIAAPTPEGHYRLGSKEGIDLTLKGREDQFFKDKTLQKTFQLAMKTLDTWLKQDRSRKMTDLDYIDESGIVLKDKSIIKIEHGIGQVLKPLFKVDSGEIEKPLPALQRPGHQESRFKWLESSDPAMQALGQVGAPLPPQMRATARTHMIFERTKALMAAKGNWSKKEFRKSLQGGILSTVTGRNFQVTHKTADGDQHMVKEISLGRSDFEGCSFVQDGQTHTVKNSINSALNSYTDQIHLFRGLVDEKGSMISFLGRVDTGDKAKQAVEGMFNACFHAEDGALKGITANEDGTYNFQMAVQSLMNMQGSQKKKFKKEIEAYQTLKNNCGQRGLKIRNWNYAKGGPEYFRVRLQPIPIAANQYNFRSRIEKLAPALWTGEAAANEASKKADDILCDLQSPSTDPVIQKQIQDTKQLLREAYSEKGRFSTDQILMLRYFLCKLLNIPIISHCLSSKERGPAATSNEVAIHQWLQDKKPIPIDAEGRFAIYKIAEDAHFKESVANSFYRNLKLLETSQGKKGGKYYRGIGQNPTIERLPDDYLKPFGGKWTYPLIGLLAVIYYPLLLLTAPVAAAIEYRKHTTMDSLHCLRTFWKHVFSLADKKVLNENLGFTSGPLQILS